MVQGKKVLAGNSKLMESEKIAYAACDAAGTKFYVAADGSYVGCILIADEVKPDSKCAIAELKKIGVEKTVMLTGDNERIGKSVADELGLDAYYAQLLPDQKVEKLEMLDKSRNQFVSNASHELKTPLATMKILLESIIYQPDMTRACALSFSPISTRKSTG